MSCVLIKNIFGHRKVVAIGKVDAETLVAGGAATQCPGYPDIYEEVSDGERDQGYMTRSMVAVAPVRRGGRPPKQRPIEDAPTDGKDQ